MTVGAVMSGTVVDLAEPQSVHLVTPYNREDVHIDDEHQQEGCEEQDREHRPELEVQHETENRVTHCLTLIPSLNTLKHTGAIINTTAGVRFSAGARYFSLKRQDRFWDPSILLFNLYMRLFPRG